MTEIMEEDKVTIKEEISTVEDTCTVFVVGEDVKEESTENQGKVKYIIYMYIFIKDDRFLMFFRTSSLPKLIFSVFKVTREKNNCRMAILGKNI